jgi:hypothetical protein
MSSVIISGDTSGAVTIAAPAVAGTNTLTLQAGTATNSMNTLATAVASTSGTSIDFTSLPSWIKRITVMLNGVSTNGTSHMRVRIGSGSLQVTGYTSLGLVTNDSNTTGGITDTTGFVMFSNVAANTLMGQMVLTHVGSNVWVESYQTRNSASQIGGGGGSVTLSGALDRLALVSTDTFDAGSVNILYEG